MLAKKRRLAKQEDTREEPLRAFVHGLPGTGKSRVIEWIVRLFTEALGWEHGVQFVCVAFQNRVALKMKGSTMHACGDISLGQKQHDQKLNHTDVDILFTRNQHLRWIIFDEAFMIADDLLGLFAANFQDAARDSRYKFRVDGSIRVFGGAYFIRLYVCVFVCLFVCMFVSVSVCLCVCLSGCLFVCILYCLVLFVCLCFVWFCNVLFCFVFLCFVFCSFVVFCFVWFCFVRSFVRLCVCLFVCLFVCFFASLFLCVFAATIRRVF